MPSVAKNLPQVSVVPVRHKVIKELGPTSSKVPHRCAMEESVEQRTENDEICDSQSQRKDEGCRGCASDDKSDRMLIYICLLEKYLAETSLLIA